MYGFAWMISVAGAVVLGIQLLVLVTPSILSQLLLMTG